MRPIKFRVWDKVSGHMIMPIAVTLYTNPGFGVDFTLNDSIHAHDCASISRAKDDVILMQFTGLLDKTGKEIYEGDIVKSPGVAAGFPVIFQDGCFVGKANPNKKSWIDLRIFDVGKRKETFWEIIGNIYEHPHLLKVK